MLAGNTQGALKVVNNNGEEAFSFSLYSTTAVSVNVVVFDAVTGLVKANVPLTRNNEDVWNISVKGISWGDYYGFRVDSGHTTKQRYYNDDYLLIDPYGKQIVVTDKRGDLPEIVSRLLKSESVDRPKKPVIPWEKTVIYEVHVKGFTKLNHRLDEQLQGKYLGLSHPLSIEHFTKLGVTTIELMPCQAMVDEVHLTKNNLTNYWGYNPISFFALTSRYAAGEDPVAEFKQMVDELHSAGLEVIIDLVLNHTAEGNRNGPIVSLKGIDPTTYYLLDKDVEDPYINFTGCGNTLNAANPQVVGLWLDCLRYWYNELGVDGFRFDLGVTLGRNVDQFVPFHPFLVSISQDPLLKHQTSLSRNYPGKPSYEW
jgi:isoamylase